MQRRSRWTACSRATSASARPRSPCAPRSRRSRTAAGRHARARPLLVKQHLETFNERFAGFPVHVRALSRFQTDKEVRETVAGLADGTVDLVIGTHRILTEQVGFKDLGLLIIDEEQRFGVEHKDQLKKLKTNVDILAMSATPIPHARDGRHRHPRDVDARHAARGPAPDPHVRGPVLRAAGRGRHPSRDAPRGQVFFVHNRVSSINRVAAQLAELVPEARIAVAHGQLNEHVLEQIVVDFWEREVRRARLDHDHRDGPRHLQRQHDHHRPGRQVRLSQLHQLRGASARP